MSKKNPYKQNTFRPKNKQKCVNKLAPPFYRSSLEMKFMLKLDKDPNILEWSSEEVILKYYNSIKRDSARYFVDFWVKKKETDGTIKEYIIEIKPYKQTLVNEKTFHGNCKSSTIAYTLAMNRVNKDKWNAANKWCEEQKKKGRNISFLILTEKDSESFFNLK